MSVCSVEKYGSHRENLNSIPSFLQKKRIFNGQVDLPMRKNAIQKCPHILRHSNNWSITEICAELLLGWWAPHFDYNSPVGNLGAVAGSNDPRRCGLASSWINSVGFLPHFAEDNPSPEARKGGGGGILSRGSCQAVNNLIDWTQNSLIDNEGAVLLAPLHKMYLDSLGEKDSQYPARSLSDKVLRSFPSLKLAKSGNRVIVHSEQMRTEAAIWLACYGEYDLKTTANYLRTLVL